VLQCASRSSSGGESSKCPPLPSPADGGRTSGGEGPLLPTLVASSLWRIRYDASSSLLVAQETSHRRQCISIVTARHPPPLRPFTLGHGRSSAPAISTSWAVERRHRGGRGVLCSGLPALGGSRLVYFGCCNNVFSMLQLAVFMFQLFVVHVAIVEHVISSFLTCCERSM
jgi:hypothetical protein